MGTQIRLQCPQCNLFFDKDLKEFTRQKKLHGPDRKFYCTSKCAGIAINEPRRTHFLEIRICKCGNVFETLTGALHCSRECASRYSITDLRRQFHSHPNVIKNYFTSNNLDEIASGLRVREWDKYNNIHFFLISLSIPHLFEFNLPGTRWIFDLVLFDLNLFVEFDERYHCGNVEEDRMKDNDADLLGWNVYRINVIGVKKPYPVELISFIDRYYF